MEFSASGVFLASSDACIDTGEVVAVTGGRRV
jgi:hypothetical protein